MTPTVSLSDKIDLKVDDIPISIFQFLLQNNVKFSFTKINHGFWEKILNQENDKSEFKSDETTYIEIFNILKTINKLTNFYLGVDHGGLELVLKDINLENTRIKSIEGCDREKTDAICQLIKEYIPQDYVPCNGQIFRRAAIENKLVDFIKLCKDYDLITVGASRLINFHCLFDFKSHFHVNIHPTNAWKDRERTFNRISQLIDQYENPLVFFQGAYVATWWIYNLHGQATLIDMGRAIDVFYAESIKQSWVYYFNLERFYERYWT